MNLRELSEFYETQLFENVLPFWLKHSIDRQFGGFNTCLARDGTVIDTDKGVWQQGRFTWLLGALFNEIEDRQPWLETAKLGGRFLSEYCFDGNDGRMWFHMTRDGMPIRKRRYSYSESFAAIAFGELAKATGDPSFRELSSRCFKRFIEESENPSSEPKFESTRPTRNIGIPMITIGTAQQLRRSIQLDNADQIIDGAVEQFQRFFVKREHKCVMETVGQHGEIIDHFDGRTLNPGHAIEAAWFVLFEGKYRKDAKLVDLGCQMLDWMWVRGWDNQFGGLLYFADLAGHAVSEYWHDMKFWWPHNEAIIATLLAYQLTGNEKYRSWHQLVHDWAFAHFPDSEYGEWYGYLRRDGSVSTTLKGNLWKGPFHLPRMLLTGWQIANELI